MHELSLCRELVEVACTEAQRHAVARVRTVRVVVGQLAGVEPEALRFAFEVVARGTAVEGATLELVEELGRARCAPCATEVPLPSRFEPCPRCGGYELSLVAGDRLRLAELEVD
ncbi:MAG: hydrogenase maturation nickel metallochaperone HypA [Deltaproteobacteria bacterium]|nr:hydrogenase maturation nickel metallochaperone HypA [Deltaproteobacteria bacterium]